MLQFTPSTRWNTGLVSRTCSLAVILTALAPAQTQNAVANGDTRTISLYHTHSRESITATFRVNGSYDYATLEKLNYFLRDWRNDDQIKMDPRLFDVVWETYRESGSRDPVHIVSAYRSPATNAMLRRRSSAVAEFSQHMLGKAMDMHYTDVPMSRVREIAMRLQRGGVGYYPTSGSPFVHLDVGSVRAWPRMTYDQLARLFPDGKTVHLASNGQTLARYDEARNLVQSRNGVSVPTVAQTQSKGFFASLFGGAGDDEPAAEAAPARARGAARTQVAALNRNAAQPAPARTGAPTDDSPAAFFMADATRRAAPAPAAETLTSIRGRTRPIPEAETAPIAVARAEPPKPAPVQEPLPRQDEALIRTASFAPLPPRRPTDFPTPTLVAANVPVPLARPNEFNGRTPADEPTARVAGAADLPSVITSGGKTPVAASVGALAFAPAAPNLAEPKPAQRPTASSKNPAPIIAQPVGMRAAANLPRRTTTNTIVATRLDRSNFRTLTSPEETARMSPAVLAPVVTPLRATARAGLRDLIFAEPTNVATRFESAAPAQPRAGFDGPAVRPLPRLETASAGRTAQLN